MAITYNWDFGPLETALNEDGLTKVVKAVHWRLNAVDGDYRDTVYGAASLPSPTPEEFTDFDNLTYEIVKNWIETSLGEEAVQTYESNLANSINAQKNPVKVTLPAPWATAPVTVVGAGINEPVLPPEEPVANTDPGVV